MKCLLGIAACLATCVVSAADSQGNYAIWGAGSRSCNQYAHERADPAKPATFKDYLMGYLTAVNTLAPDTYDALGGESLETGMTWLDQYCDTHRMDSFERAIGQLLLSRHEQRAHTPPSPGRGWSSGAPPVKSP